MQPRARLVDELEDVFAELRGPEGAQQFSEQVVERGQEPRLLLLGLLADGVRAAYYHMGIGQVQAVHVHSGRMDGLNDVERIRIDRWTKPQDFVYDRGEDDWAWLHPRVRWVFKFPTKET